MISDSSTVAAGSPQVNRPPVSKARVYFVDAETGKELGVGVPHASQGDPRSDDLVTNIVFQPIGATDPYIGQQAKQGAFGFAPYDRIVSAADFPYRRVLVKEWLPGWSRVRTLAAPKS